MAIMNENWSQLIKSVDDGIRTIALNANVSHEDLRHHYILQCLYITKPLKCNISNLETKGEDEKSGHQLKNCRKLANIDKKAPVKQQQRECFGFNVNRRNSKNHQSLTCHRHQQYFRNVRGSSALPYSTSAVINTVNRMHSFKINDKFNDGNMPISKLLPQPKDSNKSNAAKFYCDIEAALAGEISDLEDDQGPTATRSITFNKLRSDNAALRTSASLAKETLSLVEEQLKRVIQLETRVVRYPKAKPLALNIIHNVYVIALEEAYAWIRLYDGKRPPCFDASHVAIKAMKPLEWEELLPGTPCVILTRFNPLDFVNDGIARELTEFESHARAIVEERYQATKTVTVRLVDFGFRLTQLSAAAIKPLTIAFDGPPLAFRLQIDSLPKQQKESLRRHLTLCVRLTVAREKQFLCWSKTWKAIDIKKRNWNKGKSDCSSSIKSSEMHDLKDQYYAPSCYGLVTRAFVSSWLNKQHKKAGGRGIEAALSGIAEHHSEKKANNFLVEIMTKDA
uniref:Tudor domain-containing protein n=1 Tax=Elaeophora elaphi TaxID=1147741 RepID=A0A0R3RHF7_9BILA